MNFKSRIIAATPFICLIVYLILGFAWGLWHPGWLVFLLIPIVPVLFEKKTLISLYPMICGIIYLVMGCVLHWWHPGWIIFLTIPVVEIFAVGKNKEEEAEENEDDEHKQ